MVFQLDSEKKVVKSQFEENIKGGRGDFKERFCPYVNRTKEAGTSKLHLQSLPPTRAYTEIAELAKVTSLDLLLIFLSFFNSFF